MNAPTPIALVARSLPEAGLKRLAEGFRIREGGATATRHQLQELAAGSVAIIADPTVRVDQALLEAAGPQLRLIANFGVGYDNIDLEACRKRGVIATNTPGVLTNATAELALALTLAAARQIYRAEAYLRAERWSGFDPTAHLGRELSGTVFGVVGLGRIGSRYAELVGPLAARILYTARGPKPREERRLGASYVEFEELIAAADVISLHLPAGPETAGLIGAAQFARMKAGAIVINTARGSLLDTAALVAALKQGTIGAAGLDVYADEPAVPAELIDAPNCILLPHIGSATTRARDSMSLLVAENALAVLNGAEPANRVC
jgi:glyoxylate reductase